MSDDRRGQHQKFLERLDASRPSIFRVAEWLHKRGYSVSIPAIQYAPTAKEHLKYVDHGDIVIEKNGKKGLVEVKHMIKRNFTCAADHKRDDILLSNVNAVKRLINRVTAYVIVNQTMTHVAVIYSNTKEHWFEKKVFAKNTQNYEMFMACPIKFVEFRCINE